MEAPGVGGAEAVTSRRIRYTCPAKRRTIDALVPARGTWVCAACGKRLTFFETRGHVLERRKP